MQKVEKEVYWNHVELGSWGDLILKYDCKVDPL
jgi:hypothetical protein